MTRKLKALARTGTGKLIVIEERVPEVRPGAVLIEVRRSLVSPGTELGGGWRALAREREQPQPFKQPQTFGYSNAGVVVKTGKGVTRFKPGDRVASVGAGYARHATVAMVPHHLVTLLPRGVSFDQGAYAMLAATALWAVRRHDPRLGESIASVGMGLVGQLCAMLFQVNGCFVIGWDRVRDRLAIAKRWGIMQTALVGREDAVAKSRTFSGGLGLDGACVSIPGEATQAIADIEKALAITPDGHPRGTITIVGGTTFAYNASLTNVDYRRASRTGPGYHDGAWEKGRDYPPVFMQWTTRTHLELGMRLIASGALPVNALTTHVVPIDRVERTIDRLLDKPDAILGLVIKMS